MALELTGTLQKTMSEVNGMGKNGTPWVKQEFVIETAEEQYPKKVCLSAWGDRVRDLKQFAIGDKLKLSFSVESREYNDRWYTDIRAFRIELAEGGSQGNTTNNSAAAPTLAPTFTEGEATDDLPF